MEDVKKVLVSYVPMLDYDKFRSGAYYDTSDLINHIDYLKDFLIVGVAWFLENDGKNSLAFVLDCPFSSKEVADHAKAWLEGDMDRMRLSIGVYHNHYEVALFPDFEKSKTRWRASRLANFGEFDTDDYEFLAFPFSCVCFNMDRIDGVNLGERVNVGVCKASEDVVDGGKVDVEFIGNFLTEVKDFR